MKLVNRPDYIDRLKGLRGVNLIKILTGVRRCGKSTVMQMYCDYLKSDGVGDDQIVFMNFENIENYKWLDDFEALYYHILSELDLSKECYVFLDEVQQIKDFERLVDGLYVKANIDLYVTGSNAYLLSGELGTMLTGRYISIHILPFSFREYVGLKKYFLDEKTNLDLGHNLENIVFLELLRRDYKINIGKANGTEIDFVVRKANGEQEYIQVAWTAKEQTTFEREIRPFGLVDDFYPRILLTTDVEPKTSYKGILKINVIDWLMG